MSGYDQHRREARVPASPPRPTHHESRLLGGPETTFADSWLRVRTDRCLTGRGTNDFSSPPPEGATNIVGALAFFAWQEPDETGYQKLKLVRRALMRGAAALAASALLLAASAVPANAQVPPTLECGRVNAYTAPTATSSGSIQLGTSTFILAAGSLSNPGPPNLVVGATVCLGGEQNAAGEFLATTVLVGDTWCGTVAAFAPAAATSRGSLTLTGNRARTVAVRQGVTLTGVQAGASQCFKFAFDGAGNPEIVGGATTLTGAPVGQLPSTSTERDAAPFVLALISIGAAGTIVTLARRASARPA